MTGTKDAWSDALLFIVQMARFAYGRSRDGYSRIIAVHKKRGSTIGEGGDTMISSPARSPKQPLPGMRLHDPLHGRQACPEFIAFDKGVGQICPGRGYFRAVPSQNGDKYVTSPPPTIVELVKTLTKGDNTGSLHTSERLGNVFLRIRVVHQSVEMI